MLNKIFVLLSIFIVAGYASQRELESKEALAGAKFTQQQKHLAMSVVPTTFRSDYWAAQPDHLKLIVSGSSFPPCPSEIAEVVRSKAPSTLEGLQSCMNEQVRQFIDTSLGDSKATYEHAQNISNAFKFIQQQCVVAHEAFADVYKQQQSFYAELDPLVRLACLRELDVKQREWERGLEDIHLVDMNHILDAFNAFSLFGKGKPILIKNTFAFQNLYTCNCLASEQAQALRNGKSVEGVTHEEYESLKTTLGKDPLTIFDGVLRLMQAYNFYASATFPKLTPPCAGIISPSQLSQVKERMQENVNIMYAMAFQTSISAYMVQALGDILDILIKLQGAPQT